MPPKTKFKDPALRCAVIAHITAGASDADACTNEGVHIRSLTRYAQTNTAFFERLTLARAYRERTSETVAAIVAIAQIAPDDAIRPEGPPTTGELEVAADTGLDVDLVQTSTDGIPSGQLNREIGWSAGVRDTLALYQRIIEDGSGKYPTAMRTLALGFWHRVYIEPAVRAQESRDRYAEGSIPTTARAGPSIPGLSEDIIRQVHEEIAGVPVSH